MFSWLLQREAHAVGVKYSRYAVSFPPSTTCPHYIFSFLASDMGEIVQG